MWGLIDMKMGRASVAMYVLNVLDETNEHDSQETMYIIMVQYHSHSH